MQHTVTVFAADGTGTGTDLSCWVDEVSINHGRDNTGAQPDASAATINFTVTPADGPLPAAVEIGATITVTTSTATTTSTRFTGRLTDLGLGWDDARQDTPDSGVGQLVAVGILADLGRRVVGDTPWPQELDGARVARVMAAAGVTLDAGYSDPGTVQILPRDVDSQPALDVAQDAAASASGILWAAKGGQVRYADAQHRRGTAVSMSIDACEILVTPTWRRTLEGLVNEVSIGYGVATDGGDQPRYVASRPESVARYGRFGYTATTSLATSADAAAMGELLLARNSTPVWVMAALPVDVGSLTPAQYDALLGLDLGSLVALTGLPVIATAPTAYSVWVEGWRERLAYASHTIDLVVSGYCRTAPAPRWDDVDPAWVWGGATYTEVRRNLTWNPIGPTATQVGWWIASRVTLAVNGDGIRGTITDANVATMAQRLNGPSGGATAVPAAAGQTFTMSADLRTNTASTGAANMVWLDASLASLGNAQGASTPLNATTYTRVKTTGAAPANTAWVVPQVGLHTGTRNVGEWVDWRTMLLERATAPTSFFDGDTPDVAGQLDFAWTSTPRNSPSTESTIGAQSGGLPADLTWDGATCLPPPADRGRWADVPASLHWDGVPATQTWDTWVTAPRPT